MVYNEIFVNKERKETVIYMEMKSKLLDYIETCGISVDYLSRVLNIDKEKFQDNGRQDWDAQELLQICGYLKVDPLEFYIKKIGKEGGRKPW